jgi:hypothetical protein
LKGARHKVGADLAVEVAKRNESEWGVADLRSYLGAALYSKWTEDADLIAEMVEEVAPHG